MADIVKVLFVGSNPSGVSPDRSAFHPNTRSRIVLDQWIERLSIEPSFMNLSDDPTPFNQTIKLSDIDTDTIYEKLGQFKDHRVIGLGQTVCKVLKKLGITYFEAPHPSGLNRKLNDIKYLDDTLARMKSYIEEV